MNTKGAIVTAGVACALACTGAARAQSSPSRSAVAGTLSEPVFLAQSRPVDRESLRTRGHDRYGSPSDGLPYEREIRLSATTRGINVARLEAIRFVTPDGREFRWTFDTFRRFEVFPLSAIAPADVAVPPGATVYVNGDIPVAP